MSKCFTPTILAEIPEDEAISFLISVLVDQEARKDGDYLRAAQDVLRRVSDNLSDMTGTKQEVSLVVQGVPIYPAGSVRKVS